MTELYHKGTKARRRARGSRHWGFGFGHALDIGVWNFEFTGQPFGSDLAPLLNCALTLALLPRCLPVLQTLRILLRRYDSGLFDTLTRSVSEGDRSPKL